MKRRWTLSVEKADAIRVFDEYFDNNYNQMFGLDTPYTSIGEAFWEECHAEGLRLSVGAGLIEQESGGRNIFGCDHGSTGDRPPYCHQWVTEQRVQRLMAGDFASGLNGVGVTQLTTAQFVIDAQDMGGAHIPRYQMRRGFRLLRQYFRQFDFMNALGAYNAGPGNPGSVYFTYSTPLAEKIWAWQKRLWAVSDLSNIDKAIDYGQMLVDPRTPYGWWDGAFPFTPGPAMWPDAKTNNPPSPRTGVPNTSGSGLINLMAATGGSDFRGGTLAYGREIQNKRQYVPGMSVKRGEVLVNDNVSGPGGMDRSHIVMVIQNGTDPMVISSDHRFGNDRPGVNIHRLSDSHVMFGYEWIGVVPGLGTD
jgi:hypothetical protein